MWKHSNPNQPNWCLFSKQWCWFNREIIIKQQNRPAHYKCSDESSDADEREKKVIALLEMIKFEKNKVTTWKSNLPIRNQLLQPVNGESKTKNYGRFKECNYEKNHWKTTVCSFWEVCQCRTGRDDCYRNKPLCPQKNTNCTFTVKDLETFNAVLIPLHWVHCCSWILFTTLNRNDLGKRGLSIVFESTTRNNHFADNNQLDTKDGFARVIKLYEVMNKTFRRWENGVLHQKNSSKQTIWTKTVRFGYKILSCAPMTVSGSKYIEQSKAYKSLCARSFIDCVSKIDNWSDREVFFEN